MAKDNNTAKWVADITVTFRPKNRYGDSTGEGELTFTKEIEADSLAILATIIENIR